MGQVVLIFRFTNYQSSCKVEKHATLVLLYASQGGKQSLIYQCFLKFCRAGDLTTAYYKIEFLNMRPKAQRSNLALEIVKGYPGSGFVFQTAFPAKLFVLKL